MKLNVSICDDDICFAKQVHQIIDDYFTQKQLEYDLSMYSSAKDLLAAEKTFDIIFLDIEMPRINGITAAKKMLEKNKNLFVFFITNYPVFIDEAFDIKAFRYLPKPVDKKRLYAGIDSAIEKINDEIHMITVTDHNTKSTFDLKLSSIIYIVNSNRRTHIVAKSHNFLVSEPFKTIKQSIEAKVDYFAESHQSYFVNLRYVTYHDNEHVILSHGAEKYDVYMSRRKYSNFEKKLFQQAGVLS